MKRRLAAFLLVVSSSAALAQTPFGRSGAEFRVNTLTTGYQGLPAVAFDSTGEFFVVWTSGPLVDKNGFAIDAQRYAATGVPIGGAFRLNATTSAGAGAPRVAGASGQQFVVVWTGEDGDSYGIFARRNDANGPAGSEFRVNASTTGAQGQPDVSSDANGNFVVVWSEPDGADIGVFGQRYASTGGLQGASFRVNGYTSGAQASPSVARSATGEFVVVWTSAMQFGAYRDIVGQRFTGAGSPLGGEFLVDATTTEDHLKPNVASAGFGFVVSWVSASTGTNIRARRYGADGAPVGSPFRVNSYSSGNQGYPAVSGDSAGNFSIAWHSGTEDGGTYGIYAQRYASSGALVGSEFRVNATTSGNQFWPRTALSAQGHLVVAWTSLPQDGSLEGVYAQRYCTALAGDADGSGAIGVSDVFFLINGLFAGGPGPVHGSDANGDGVVNIGDVFYLINYLFAGGPGPACVS